ncbi:hypothetical protein NFJ02_23g53540 [Pycnococcus provasolii]
MAAELGLEDAAPHGAYTPIDVCALVAPYRPPLALALAISATDALHAAAGCAAESNGKANGNGASVIRAAPWGDNAIRNAKGVQLSLLVDAGIAENAAPPSPFPDDLIAAAVRGTALKDASKEGINGERGDVLVDPNTHRPAPPPVASTPAKRTATVERKRKAESEPSPGDAEPASEEPPKRTSSRAKRQRG